MLTQWLTKLEPIHVATKSVAMKISPISVT